MCRLLGVVANKSVDLEFSLHKFEEFSARNPDGWGLGWYENNCAKIFKQGISAKDRESKMPQLSKEVVSKVIIAHVRKGTVAPPSELNSHPFRHENWLFAHNGSVDVEYVSSLLGEEYKDKLTGETDSEAFFYLIMQRIEESGDVIEGIKTTIAEVKARKHSGLNFLLSEGKTLYAFRYSSRSRDYYSLYYLKREPSEPGLLEFVSGETRALLRSKSLKRERAVLVCSEKLTEEKWEDVGLGKLLIVKPGLDIEEVQIF